MNNPTPLPQNVYELIENDNNEIMLLLYAGESTPTKTSFHLNEAKKCIELYRNPSDTVIIEGLQPDSINKLKQINILYVCEMKYNENPNSESEIIYAYEAHPKKESPQKPKQPSKPSLTEKAKQAREKILKKEG